MSNAEKITRDVRIGEWLSTLSPSLSRDHGVSTFAELLAESDPERAVAWAETIKSAEVRDQLTRRLRE